MRKSTSNTATHEHVGCTGQLINSSPETAEFHGEALESFQSARHHGEEQMCQLLPCAASSPRHSRSPRAPRSPSSRARVHLNLPRRLWLQPGLWGLQVLQSRF